MKSHTKIFLFITLGMWQSKIQNQQDKWILWHINKNKYLMIASTNESKGIIKKYEELWNKIRDLISSITKISDDYYEKYMKI